MLRAAYFWARVVKNLNLSPEGFKQNLSLKPTACLHMPFSASVPQSLTSVLQIREVEGFSLGSWHWKDNTPPTVDGKDSCIALDAAFGGWGCPTKQTS